MKINWRAILAGFLIGIGVIANTIVTVPIVGPVLFSLGLLSIIALQLPLFTGKIGIWYKFSWKELINILLYNFIGIILAIGIFTIANPIFIESLTSIAQIKFAKTWFQMLASGFICGSLVHLAVKIKHPIITILAVVTFILVGAEHCIADFPYLCAVFSWQNILKFANIIIGNSLGAMFIEVAEKEWNLQE